MNNLKRVLSLALASIMVIGMMVVGSSAAEFTDAEEIQHGEAVDVLVALGIINGKEDGSYFAPQDNVTRAEMAKMLAVVMKGGNDVDTGVKGVPSFTDIGGHWAETYIEYCYDLGIINGRGDGTFDPNANVTGTEVTKMVLTALGYDAEAYGLTGAAWATRTDELARKASPSLFEDLSGVVLAVPASRDNAAQIIWNGLQNDTMQYTPSVSKTSTGVEWEYGTSGTPLLTERYDASIWYGRYTGNYKTDTSLNDGEVIVTGAKNQDDYKGNTLAYVPSDMGIENIGEKVKVIWKDGTGGTKNQPDKKDTIYGVFNVGDTQTVEITRAQVKDGSDSPSATDKVNLNGTTYTIASAPSVIEWNYDDTVTAPLNKTNVEALKKSQNNDKIKFILDDDGKLYSAYVTETKMTYVTAVNSSKITLNGVGSINIADNDVYDAPAKWDIVTYTKLYEDARDDAYFIVKKAEKVEGVLNKYKGTENLVLDGTTYKTYEKKLDKFGDSITIDEDTTVSALSDGDIGETYAAYLVNGTVGYLIQTSDAMKDYAVVTAFNSGTFDGSFSPAKVELLLADGTKVTAELHKDSVIYKDTMDGASNVDKFNTKLATTPTKLVKGDTLSDQYISEGQLVKYSVSGGKYKIEEIGIDAGNYNLTANTYGGTGVVYDKDLKTFMGQVTSGDCVLFVWNENSAEFKVYNIRDLGDVTATIPGTGMGVTTTGAIAGYYKDGSNKVVAAFATVASRPSGAGNNTFYGIVSGGGDIIKEGDDSYKVYTVENNEETIEVKLDSVSASTKLATGSLVSFEIRSNGIYTLATDIDVLDGSNYAQTDKGLVGWVKEYSAKDQTISIYTDVTGSESNGYKGGTVKTYALDDKVQVVYVDSDEEEAGEDIGVNEFNGVEGYQNVLLVAEDNAANAKVAAIIIESSGKTNIINSVVSPASATADQVKTSTTIEGLDDGVYTPETIGATTALTGANAAATAADVRIFKFTAANADATHTLTIKDKTGTVVYAGTITTGTKDKDYYVWCEFDVGTPAAAHTFASTSTAWSSVTEGYYTFTIAGSSGNEVMSGFFTI